MVTLTGHPGASNELRVAPVDPCRVRSSAELTCSAWREGYNFLTARSTPGIAVTFLLHTYRLQWSIAQNTAITYHSVGDHVAFLLLQRRHRAYSMRRSELVCTWVRLSPVSTDLRMWNVLVRQSGRAQCQNID